MTSPARRGAVWARVQIDTNDITPDGWARHVLYADIDGPEYWISTVKAPAPRCAGETILYTRAQREQT